MSEHPRCPDCGAELPTGATAGLCPKCLLGGALEGSDALVGEPSPFVPTTPQPGGFVPPGVQSLAASFPQLEIVGLLGHGGMGAVYKARQTKLDRFVALKIIRPESADDPAFAERFTREARTLARLSHPNIVAVHDFGELPGGLPAGSAAGSTLFYFLMEYVEGANLRELMQSGGLRPEQALAIVPQICDALQYAHDEGVVHRDIKPENILVDRRGRVKIADFGLAKLAGQAPENFTLTATHQVMGTPRYMAPEQMAGSRAVDHRADIYSLGVVFYEMLTGELPLGSFEPPSRKTAIDPRLDEVVLRALAREPERRYQRASEVRTDVESILRGELAVSGRPSSDSRPESESGQSAGEAIWEIAGILASGWLVYIVLMVCIGAVVLALRTPISTQRASDVPGGPAIGFTPSWIVLAAVILVAGLAGLFKHRRRRSAGRRAAFIAGASEIGASSAPNSGDRQLPSVSPPSWSSQQHVSMSGPGASTVLERGLAGLVNQFRPGSGSPRPLAAIGAHPPRFSRKAILAACWAPLVIGVPLAFVPMRGPIVGWPLWWQWPLIFTIGPLGAIAPFGTTILGLIAISDIRHSRGRLIGLPLAFADAVLFPILVLDLGILALSQLIWIDQSESAIVAGLIITLLFAAGVDYLLLRAGWRAVSSPVWNASLSETAGQESDLRTTRPDRARLQSEHRSSGRPETGWAALSADKAAEIPAGTEAVRVPAVFPDLDLRRIQMELQGPAGGLVILAALGALHWLALGFILAFEGWSLQYGRFTGEPEEVVAAALGALVVLLLLAVLVSGARQMRRMSGYEWCMAASILAMLPWSLAVVVGLPVGIWAFRLLRRPDVRDAFLAQAIERERSVRPLVARGGRDWVTLTREQVEDDDLPDVCMVCGAPTQDRVNKEFSWAPDWAGFLCLIGLWPGLIAMALTGKSMRVACPLCPADRGHWSRLVWVSSVGWLVMVPLAGIGYLIAEALGGRADTPLAATLAGAGLGLVLWLVPVIYLASTRVSAKSITDDRVTLQRVSPMFARAVSDRRARPAVDRELSTAGRVGD